MADVGNPEQLWAPREGIRFFVPNEQIRVHSEPSGDLSFEKDEVRIPGFRTGSFVATKQAEGLEVGETEDILIITHRGIYKGPLRLFEGERLLFVAHILVKPFLPGLVVGRLRWPQQGFSAECQLLTPETRVSENLPTEQVTDLWVPHTPEREFKGYKLIVPPDATLLSQLEFSFRKRI